jgi:hypothetical protein
VPQSTTSRIAIADLWVCHNETYTTVARALAKKGELCGIPGTMLVGDCYIYLDAGDVLPGACQVRQPIAVRLHV